MLKIIRVERKENIEIVKKLFLEYASSLGFNLCFQNFDRELEDLPGDYSPPKGCLLLAIYDEKVVGCVALRPITDTICEMKRLYVKPEFRGKGIGRKLATEIIEEARKIGYKYMRLDTIPSMKEAISLYYSLGFKEIDPYRYNPIEGAMFMELKL
jgi:ribosomal protein S18 acetylase RimI-like enzyme